MSYILHGSRFANIKNRTINITTALVLTLTSISGAAPLFLSQKAFAIGETVNIADVTDLCNAIDNQEDGQTWIIGTGTYGLTHCNSITAEGQTGWYFPITKNHITINGIGNPTIFGTGYTANGAWNTQNLVTIFGNNVTLNGLTFMPKVEPNKTIEVLGDSATIKNVTITPNTLTDQSEYDNISNPTDPSWTQYSKTWGGSIYYSNATGTQTLDNVLINNGGVSVHAPGTTFNVTSVRLSYTTDVDWINDYRFYVASPTSVINGVPNYTYHVNSTLNNFDSVLAAVGDPTTVLGIDTISLDSAISTAKQITLAKPVMLNGNGHTISPHFTKTDDSNNSAIGIQADNVTISNLVEDGTNGGNLHGVNVYSASVTNLNDVTVKNNDYSGLNVNRSAVTVNNLTTSNNGWHGVDVDKAGAVLTVNGTSHHSETTPDIYIDATGVGQVVDTNSQYGYLENVLRPGDRAYKLKLAAPTLVYPLNNGYTTTNDFYFDWGDVTGAVSYEFQNSLTSTTDSNDSLTSVHYSANSPTSQLHSVGAPDGTVRYWQVRAVDAYGIKSDWSGVWKMTIDMTTPNKPTNLSWKTTTNVVVANNGYTNVYGGTASWNDSSSDVNHYIYKYWNDISGNPYKVGSEYSTNVGSTSLIGAFNQGEGVHHFCIEAVDNAGNTSACSDTYSVTYDPVAPKVGLTAPKGITNANTAEVKGYVTDSNMRYYACYITTNQAITAFGMPWSAGQEPKDGTLHDQSLGDHNCVTTWTSTDTGSSTSPVTLGSFNTSGLPDGGYTIYVHAHDLAGNVTTESTIFTIDRTAPVLTISHAANTDGTYTISGTTTDPTSPIVVRLNGTSLTPVNLAGNNWNVTTTVLPADSYAVTADSTDTAGNPAIQVATNFVFGVLGDATSDPQQAAGNFVATSSARVHGSTTGSSSDGSGTAAPASDSTGGGGEVKAAETQRTLTNDNNKSSDTVANSSSSRFLGLGWWWLLIVALALGFLWFLLGMRDHRSEK